MPAYHTGELQAEPTVWWQRKPLLFGAAYALDTLQIHALQSLGRQ